MSGINKVQWSKSELVSALNAVAEDDTAKSQEDINSDLDGIAESIENGDYGEIPGIFELRTDIEQAYELFKDPSDFKACISGLIKEINNGAYDQR